MKHYDGKLKKKMCEYKEPRLQEMHRGNI